MAPNAQAKLPGSIYSLLDTDLYKLTMQCAVLKFFPHVEVSYQFTNRTAHMKLNYAAFIWLQQQIANLKDVHINVEELRWLRETCPYLSQSYLEYLETFRFRPSDHIRFTFTPDNKSPIVDGSTTPGHIGLSIHGLWVETILYEIPLLALTSEAYFKFIDRDWSYDEQRSCAKQKCQELLSNGIAFSEFGSRRRRDYRTHDLVMQGIMDAVRDAHPDWKGVFSGTSNVHLAMKHGCNPVGTVAHEWFMGIAAITGDYENANEASLRYWLLTYGPGVLGIALTDTFGTQNFLRAFSNAAPSQASPYDAPIYEAQAAPAPSPAGYSQSYAQVFAGVRQDSGDPLRFLDAMKAYYASQNLLDVGAFGATKKSIVYSDSLTVAKCLTYARATLAAGLQPAFGIGTHFTNDFARASAPGEKSAPLNIVIKLSSAAGRSAVKLSDDEGKHMGVSAELIAQVKQAVGYEEGGQWEDERARWG